MNDYANVEIGCRLVGEFVDRGEVSDSLADGKIGLDSHSQVERPRLVASFIDGPSDHLQDREFKVLLQNQRIATVRGHFVQFVPNPGPAGDSGSYGIVRRIENADVLVALFKVCEVTGVFSGDLSGSSEVA